MARRLSLYEATSSQGRDLRLLTFTPTVQVAPLVESRFEERGGIVSPDGRWLVYDSNSSGRYEIYVRPFPAVGEGLWQVSTAGGAYPLWAPRGQELFYVGTRRCLDGGLCGWRGDVDGQRPARLLEGRYVTGAGQTNSRQYDVTADGQRFLLIKEDPADRRRLRTDHHRA